MHHKIIILFSLLLFLISFSATAKDNESINLRTWSQLPTLHEGRLKPLDSFARIHLKKFSVQEKIHDLNATKWLAKILFTPEEAALIPTFKIREFAQYGLEKRKDKLYSYVEITPLLEKQEGIIQDLLNTDPEQWTSAQQDLITLYNNAHIYAQLLRSFTALLPLNASDNSNYLDLKKASRNNTATPQENNILDLLEAGGTQNNYLKITPEDWSKTNQNWLSIWSAATNTDISAQTQKHLNHWSNLAAAYRDNDGITWQKTIKELTAQSSNHRLKLEYFYNLLQLLTIAGILYFLTFIFILSDNILDKKYFKRFANIAFITAIMANAFDIILRVYILQRPPVGTLYESIIFVALICTLSFFFMERKHKNQTGLLLGSVTGTLLILTARSFSGDDNMDTLVAVLNTNFWLLTHVICITIGYAVCFLAAMMAHYFLILKIWRKDKTDTLKQLQNGVKTLSIVALLFTTIGTILGGIWADQSWGRFWGWDPKENGALLIVLWLIWLLHSRISKDLNELGFMIGSAFLSVIVVLAWFGVNLLSVGLHSYGFISGIALGISAFCIGEIIILGILYVLIRRKREGA